MGTYSNFWQNFKNKFLDIFKTSFFIANFPKIKNKSRKILYLLFNIFRIRAMYLQILFFYIPVFLTGCCLIYFLQANGINTLTIQKIIPILVVLGTLFIFGKEIFSDPQINIEKINFVYFYKEGNEIILPNVPKDYQLNDYSDFAKPDFEGYRRFMDNPPLTLVNELRQQYLDNPSPVKDTMYHLDIFEYSFVNHFSDIIRNLNSSQDYFLVDKKDYKGLDRIQYKTAHAQEIFTHNLLLKNQGVVIGTLQIPSNFDIKAF